MCTRFSAFNPARKQAIWDVDPGFLDSEAASRALSPLLERALVVHAFGYGEPTIHPSFPSFLEHVSQYEVLVDFFTNGMHLTEELVRDLVELSVHQITVSFSGSTPELYESVYQGGNFERVVSGLARLRDAKRSAGSPYPRVRINSLAFDHHVRELDRFLELMASYGVSGVEVTRLLEHTAVLPALAGHSANLKSPEIRAAFERAQSAARELEIELSLHPRIEAELALPEERGAPAAGPARVPVGDFLAVARGLPALPASREGGPRLRVIDIESEGVDEVRRRLHVQACETSPGAERFHCLEPFKTFYLRRGGQVKTCCYMGDEAPAMGDIQSSSGEKIWNGIAYEVARGAIVNGQYPMAACGSCLANRQAPASHGIDRMLRDYSAWSAGAADSILDSPEIEELAAANGAGIVGRLFARHSPAASAPGAPERIEKLLAAIERDPLWWSAIEGWVDHASERGVAGWVYSPLFTELRFPVSLWIGDRKIREGVAGELRPDLAAAGQGDGRYGFGFPVPLTVEEARSARVRLGNSRCELERITAIEGR